MELIDNFNKILTSFNIKALCTNYEKIDNYFFYDLKLFPNAKVKDIQKYSNEISLILQATSKPNIRVLHNKGVVRLEYATPRTSPLNLFDYFTNDKVPQKGLPCLLGQTVDGEPMWMDLAANPHMIVAGTTGSGKSTLLHTIIANIFNYNNCHLFLSDPKNIEFSEYNKRCKSNVTVSNSYTGTLMMLDSILELMEHRYEKMRQNVSIEKFPYILLIIDEFADLIMQDKDDQFYNKLCRLAQKCRAARISIILSTQRPSVNIINGVIKANFPARIACKVVSHVDSKVILDTSGAENLLGNGDALIRDNFRFLQRFQIAYTSADEICKYFGE